jgi:hypothetical protein
MTSSHVDIRRIMALRPQIHRSPDGVEMDMSLGPDVLDFLLENIPPDASTLESGAALQLRGGE